LHGNHRGIVAVLSRFRFSEVVMSPVRSTTGASAARSSGTWRTTGLIAGGIAALTLAVTSFGLLPRSFADGAGGSSLPAHLGQVMHTYRNLYCYQNQLDQANPERELLTNVVRTQSGSDTWLETDASYEQWIKDSKHDGHYQNNGAIFRHTAGPGAFSDDLQPNDICQLNNQPGQIAWSFGAWA
jgi:hypothetical protein